VGDAKLLKKYALTDPTHVLKSHGWSGVSTKYNYTMWRNAKFPAATLFVYSTGEWHLVGKLRKVLFSGNDVDSMIAWVTGSE
jgi:hypothetical protein